MAVAHVQVEVPVVLEVREAAAEAGVEITGFVRMAVGEGIEKEKEDFAAEVAKALNG